MNAGKQGSLDRERPGRPLLVAWLHLAVLWSFAVAQPLFDVLADSPEFFVARGNTAGDILLLGFGLVLVPPTGLWLAELLLLRAPSARRALHLLFVGVLSAAIAIQICKSARSGPGVPLTALALLLGAGAALLYARAAAARTVLTVLSPAPAVFLALFLLASPVADLFRSDDDVPVREDVRAGAPVVMVVFDEFSVETLMGPGGDIDAVRFPNFAELAKTATWYRNATTISDHTTDAVPAILTGRYPERDSLPTATDHPRNLFTLLGGSYSLRNVNEPATDLCPSKLCGDAAREPAFERLKSLAKDLTVVGLHRVLPNRLAERLPAVDQGFANFADQGRDAPAGDGDDVAIPGTAYADRPGQFQRFIEQIDAGHAPSLNFLHLLLPHTPWQYLPTGQQYEPPPGEEVPGVRSDGWWTDDPALPGQAFQRSALQVGALDRLVGRLVDRLRAADLWDETLLVLTADHGISFRPDTSRRTANGAAAADVLGVPLFVKPPGQRQGGVDDRQATTADIMPTVADALEVRRQWRSDGASLLRPAARDPRPVSVSVFPSRERVDIPFGQYVRARDAEVSATRFRQGPGRGWGLIYAMGADSDLFGRPVADLPSGSGARVGVELERPGSYDSVDPDGRVVPAFLAGRLTGAAAPGLRLAVAVNGVVRATAPAYEADGETRFGAIVPPSAFRAGSNAVRMYVVEGHGEARRLRAVPAT